MAHRSKPPTDPMLDFVIDVEPELRYARAMKALGLSVAGDVDEYRQAITEGGIDPVRAAVAYLEDIVSQTLDARVEDLGEEAAGRALLAEELLVILTGSSDLEAVRAWLQAPAAEAQKAGG